MLAQELVFTLLLDLDAGMLGMPRKKELTYRSPYTRCLLRLGLLPGVLSLVRTDPTASNSFNRLDNASASMASDVLLLCVFVELSPNSRLDIVGGVFEPAGVGRVGVCGLPVISTEIPSVKSFIVMIAVIEQGVTPGTRMRLCDPRKGVLNCQRFDSLTRPSVLWPQTV